MIVPQSYLTSTSLNMILLLVRYVWAGDTKVHWHGVASKSDRVTYSWNAQNISLSF